MVWVCVCACVCVCVCVSSLCACACVCVGGGGGGGRCITAACKTEERHSDHRADQKYGLQEERNQQIQKEATMLIWQFQTIYITPFTHNTLSELWKALWKPGPILIMHCTSNNKANTQCIHGQLALQMGQHQHQLWVQHQHLWPCPAKQARAVQPVGQHQYWQWPCWTMSARATKTVGQHQCQQWPCWTMSARSIKTVGQHRY